MVKKEKKEEKAKPLIDKKKLKKVLFQKAKKTKGGTPKVNIKGGINTLLNLT